MADYVPSTSEETADMLKALGMNDWKELYRDVPDIVFLSHKLDLPSGKSEMEVRDRKSVV